MKNKVIISLFALFVFIALPAAVLADDANETNTTGNVTYNNTNVTANVTNTTNTTINTTTNTSANSSYEDDDDNEKDDEDDKEDIDMKDVALGNTNKGMEVRLLQLQKSLERNTENAQMILDEIDRQNISVDTDKLESLLDDAKDLGKEIQHELDATPVNVSTQEFVSYKAEAINISHAFKKELYTVLTPQQLNSIKSALKDDFAKNEKNSQKLAAIKARIAQKAKEHNIEQALKMYNKFSLNDTELKEKIESGNFTAKELKDELKSSFKEMKKSQKAKAEKQIGEEQEKIRESKARMNGKNMKLDNEEVDTIVSDDSLTWEEKETKMRVLAHEKKENRDGKDNKTSQNGLGKGPRGDD